MTDMTWSSRDAAAEAAEDEAFGEPSTDVEVRVADLAAKIDRLTELVLALRGDQLGQQAQGVEGGDEV